MAILRTIAPAPRSGTFTLPATAVPTSGADRYLNVVADIPLTAEQEDPALSFSLMVERSPDGVSDWRMVAGCTWSGHPPGIRPWTSPGFGVEVTPLRGAFIRATATVPVSITIGATVTTT
jgi:hypothetical protein